MIDKGMILIRKVIDAASSTLDIDKRRRLFWNGYVSSFFRKEKVAVRRAMIKKAEYVDLFANLGTTPQISEEVEELLENFVCAIYENERMQSVTDVRRKIFLREFDSEKKIANLTLLRPCHAILKLHIK